MFSPENTTEKQQYISLQDAAKYCEIYSQEYLSLRARQGKMRAVKLGRNWVTTKAWVDEYIHSENNIKANGFANGKNGKTTEENVAEKTTEKLDEIKQEISEIKSTQIVKQKKVELQKSKGDLEFEKPKPQVNVPIVFKPNLQKTLFDKTASALIFSFASLFVAVGLVFGASFWKEKAAEMVAKIPKVKNEIFQNAVVDFSKGKNNLLGKVNNFSLTYQDFLSEIKKNAKNQTSYFKNSTIQSAKGLGFEYQNTLGNILGDVPDIFTQKTKLALLGGKNGVLTLFNGSQKIKNIVLLLYEHPIYCAQKVWQGIGGFQNTTSNYIAGFPLFVRDGFEKNFQNIKIEAVNYKMVLAEIGNNFSDSASSMARGVSNELKDNLNYFSKSTVSGGQKIAKMGDNAIDNLRYLKSFFGKTIKKGALFVVKPWIEDNQYLVQNVAGPAVQQPQKQVVYVQGGGGASQVTKITQVQPVKEITKEVIKETVVSKIDNETIAELRGNIAYLQELANKVHYYSPSNNVATSPVYIGSSGIEVGGNGLFSSLGVSGFAGIRDLGVGNTLTVGDNNLFAVDKNGHLKSSGVTTGGVSASNIASSGDISANGNLSVVGNVDIDGTLNVGGTVTFSTTSVAMASTSMASLAVGTSSLSNLFTVAGTGNAIFQNTGQVYIVPSGTTTIGAATSTPIVLTGYISSDILPTYDNTYDLGASSYRWQQGYFGDALYVGTSTSPALFVNGVNNKVGIGTSTAYATLDIKGMVGADLLRVASSTGNVLFTILQTGNIGIGTTTPAALLNVYGSSILATYPLLRVSTSTTEALFVSTAGNVGVGTTSPIYKFMVDGNSYFSGNSTTSGNFDVLGNLKISGNSITLGENSVASLVVNTSVASDFIPDQNATRDIGSAAYYWDYGYFDHVVANNLSAASSTVSGTQSEIFTINSDNATADTETQYLNFFRGTVVPNALLTWDAAADKFDFNQPVFIQNDSSTTTVVSLDVWGTSGQTSNFFRVASSSGDILLNVSSNGRVGIGTSTPATALQIYSTDGLTIPVGTTLQRPSSNATGTVRYNLTTSQFEGYSGTSWGSLGGLIDIDQDTYISAETSPGADNDELRFFASGLESAKLNSSGNFGIGTTTPAALLNVYGSSILATYPLLRVSTSTTEALFVSTAGNVGVGTTSPIYKFQVDGASYFGGNTTTTGSAYFAGAVQIGGALTLGSTLNIVATSTQATTTITNLGISGNGSVLGAWTVSGTSTLATTSITLLTVSGNSVLSGNLTVNTTTTLNGDITLGDTSADNIVVNGRFSTTTFTGGAVIGGDISGILDLTVSGTSTQATTTITNLGISGNGSVLGAWTVSGTSTLATTSITLLTVSGNAVLSGNLTVNTTTTLNGDITLGDTSADNIVINGTVSTTTFANGTIIGRDISGILDLTVSGTSTLATTTITNLGISGNGSVLGAWTVNGTSTLATTTATLLTVLGNGIIGGMLAVGTTSAYTTLDVKSIAGLDAFRIASSTQNTWLTVLQTGNVGLGTTTPTAQLSVYGNKANSIYPLLQIATSTTEALFVSTAGLVGIGTTTPTAKLHIYGSNNDVLRLDGAAANQTSLEWAKDNTTKWITYIPGNSNDLLFYDVAGVANSVTFQQGGNVGIGTTTPNKLLNLYSTNPSIGITDSDAELNGKNFEIYTNNGIGYITNRGDSWLGGDSLIKMYGALGDISLQNDKVMIKNNGNVGIGTTTPEFKLTVRTSTAYDGIALNNNNGNTVFKAAINAASNGSGYIRLYDNSGNSNILLDNNGDSYIIGGNVGIGTISPGAKLHSLAANSQITNSPIYAGGFNNGGVIFGHAGLGTVFQWQNGNDTINAPNYGIYIGENGFYDGANWSVKNSVVTPVGILMQANYGNTGGIHFYVNTESNIPSTYTPNEVMTLRGYGVGIGTTTPVYALQVNGQVAGTAAYVITTSHSSLKEQFEDVFVLDKIKAMNLWEWQYKPEYANGDAYRHLYPTTDDFYSAFGLGKNDWTISEADIAGVALKGVKDILQTINIKQDKTTGDLVKISVATTTILTGDVAGLNIDLSTNVQPGAYNLVGLNIKFANSGVAAATDPTFAKFVVGNETLYNFSASGANFKAPVVIESNLQIAGKTIFTGTTTQVINTTSTEIAVASSTNIIIFASSSLTLYTSPTIANGTPGQFVILQAATGSLPIILQDQDVLAGSNLQLGSTVRQLDGGDTLGLMFNGEDWVELWFSGDIDADYAEMYKTQDQVEAGDVVSFNTSQYLQVGKAKIGDSGAAGIISAQPAYLIGKEFKNQMQMPVALAGRVPVKISLEAGDIKTGDLLVLSTKPGYAMKYNPDYLRQLSVSNTDSGLSVFDTDNTDNSSTSANLVPIIGVALEDYPDTTTQSEFLETIYKTLQVQFKNNASKTAINQLNAKYKAKPGSSLTTSSVVEVRAEYAEKYLQANIIAASQTISERVEKIVNPQYKKEQSEKIMAMLKTGYVNLPREAKVAQLTVVEKDGNLFLQAIGENFALKLDLTIDSTGALLVENLKAKKLEVGTTEKPTGITIYDADTGKPFCLIIKSGEMKHLLGACDNQTGVVEQLQQQSAPNIETPISPNLGTSTPPNVEISPESSTTTQTTIDEQTTEPTTTTPVIPDATSPSVILSPQGEESPTETIEPASESPNLETPNVEISPEPAPEPPAQEPTPSSTDSTPSE